MGYLFFQTLIWLLLAAFLGLFIGWLIWGKRPGPDCSGVEARLNECERRCAELHAALKSTADA